MDDGPYTSKVIKASALLADTKVLLSAWDGKISVQANMKHALKANILGKASRSRAEDVLLIFRQRYFGDEQVGNALVALAQAGAPSAWLDPLLYFYTLQNDATLRALVTEVVWPRKRAGHTSILVEHFLRAIRNWVAEGKTTSEWNEETRLRIARNGMAALRDFGILQGANKKSISNVYLPVPSFSFLAMELLRREGSGVKVLQSEDWRLFFLELTAVERFLLEAHQERLLSYHAAGSVVRLEFPAQDLVEYAHVLIESARAQA